MAGGNVPAQYAPIFQAAGKQYGIPASVLAGVASVETNLGANNQTSSTGAQGLMQFEPGTARSIGINPNDPKQAIFGAAKLLVQYGYHQDASRALGAYNGGPGNPQYSYARQVISEAKRLAPQLSGGNVGLPAVGASSLGQPQGSSSSVSVPVTTRGFDQAGFKDAMGRFIAGQFVQDQGGSSNPYNASPGASKGFSAGLNVSNPLLATGQLTTTQPSAQDFATSETHMQQVATGQLQQLAGGSLVNVHAGAQGYVNPIAGAVIGRTDMGVDANLKVGAPIRAIGDSKVLGIYPNWFRGQPYLELQLTSGPKAGQVYYVAEQISPTVRPGQTVRAGQTIATYAPSGTGIEIGWGAGGGRTLAQAQGNTGDASHGNAPAGTNFRAFLGGLK